MSANAKGGAAKLAAPQGLLCYLTSAIRASPTMTCGIPRTILDVAPYPVGSSLVGNKRCIGAVEDADGDQHPGPPSSR